MNSVQINEPLLYIDQPTLSKPKVKMQKNFQTGPQTPSKKYRQHKSFKECSIKEKIQYLLHIPKELPNLKCDVLTETESYRGMLVKEDKEYIFLRQHGRREQTILKSEIKDIRLISF